MGVGAKDYIDQLLAKKYQNEKANNFDMNTSAVPPEKMMEVLNDYAAVHKTLLNLSSTLKKKCGYINSKLAYQKT